MAKENNIMKEIIDGSVLTKDAIVKQLPLILFIILLTFLYIANRYHAEKLARDATRTQREIKALRSESISIASEYMYLTKQSELQNLVTKKKLGLTVSKEPPKKVIIEKE